MTNNFRLNADSVRLHNDLDFIATSEIPAWDERYVLKAGTYRVRLKQYHQGHPFAVATVRAEVVSAKKPTLFGGVAVTAGNGPEAGTIIEIDIPIEQLYNLGGVTITDHFDGRRSYAVSRNGDLKAHEGLGSLDKVVEAYRKEKLNDPWAGGHKVQVTQLLNGEFVADVTPIIEAFAKAK